MFGLLAVTNTAWQREKAAGDNSSDLDREWLPTLDTLRNFLLMPTTEMLTVFQTLCDAVSAAAAPTASDRAMEWSPHHKELAVGLRE